MSWEQRNHDFCNAQTDAQMAYIEAEREVDELQTENEKLRKLARGLQYCAKEAYGMCARVPVGGSRPFTCCPLYDFDAKVYGCEKLRLELGIGIEQ